MVWHQSLLLYSFRNCSFISNYNFLAIKFVVMNYKPKPTKNRLEDSSAAPNTGCSCRRPEFHSQHPHGGSQLAVTLVPGSNFFFWPPEAPATHVIYTHMHRQNTHAHKMKVSKSLKEKKLEKEQTKPRISRGRKQ